MSVLSDREILERCSVDPEKSMIYPYIDHPVRYVNINTGKALEEMSQYKEHEGGVRRVISYGPTSYGYDVRLGGDYNNMRLVGVGGTGGSSLNPKKMDMDTDLQKVETRIDEDGSIYVDIPPCTCLLAPTIEYFRIPRDTIVIVTGKSTYARAGLIVNVTPIEPEFEGNVVMEVINPTKAYIRCYLYEGIAQFVFHGHNDPCLRSYKDKGGKYQGQTGLTLGKV